MSDVLVEDGVKLCRKCDTVKPLIEFSKNVASVDGHLHDCKDCWRQYRATPVDQRTKHCRGCGQNKLLAEFSNTNFRGAYGVFGNCKDCYRQYQRDKRAGVVAVQKMGYYRVSCEEESCNAYINVAALDTTHLIEVLNSLQNKDKTKWVATVLPDGTEVSYCPKHMDLMTSEGH